MIASKSQEIFAPNRQHQCEDDNNNILALWLKVELIKAKRTLYEHKRKASDKRNKLKQVLHHHMIPILSLYTRALLHRVRVEVLSNQKKKIK